jgi:hypothetical protein
MFSNFTFQDIFGIFLAFSLYPFIFVFPGYVTGWLVDIFNFRKRTSIVQIIMAMTISVSIVPAILFLVYRFTSYSFVVSLLILFAVVGIYIFIKFYKRSADSNEYKMAAVTLALLWVFLSVFILVDFQIGESLYFSANSYDLTTRVSVVDAVTRTGVPPVNPSYYPGQPVLLNFLYYYWYILASVVDQMGGIFVSAHQAMIASISWAGILLFATLATYLRVRDNQPTQSAWRKSFIAIQLFAISGLDFIVVMIIVANFNFKLGLVPFQEQFEGWNMPIMSWMNALAWVPHHLAAALACVTTMLIATQNMQKKYSERIFPSIIIGLAFASAFGLSVWVMFVFAAFWVVWALILVIHEKKYQQFIFMIISGLFGVIFVAPFLFNILVDRGTGSSGGELPVALYVRPFLITDILSGFSQVVIDTLSFTLLPLNYLFELGFFFLMAFVWLQEFYKQNERFNPLYKAELTLVLVSIFVLTFLRSTIIAINDLGIRGWLPLQFILVVWSADVIFKTAGTRKWISSKIFDEINGTKTLKLALSVMLIIGFLTTGLEVLSLRTWSMLVDNNIVGFPNRLSPDAHLGERTYSARLAYNYLHEHIPADSITQNNPLDFLDRPSGLYGTHQMVISNRTSYGVPVEIYNTFVDNIAVIFTRQTTDWDSIDTVCIKYSIDVLIIKDTDPLWDNLEILKQQRHPLYENKYYALYSCGENVN